MKDTKETKSAKAERLGGSSLKSCWCNFENMAQMMRRFCAGEETSFDCSGMMQKMCGTPEEKSDRQ